MVFPDAVNVLPWMLCVANGIGEATAAQMGAARLVEWSHHGICGAVADHFQVTPRESFLLS